MRSLAGVRVAAVGTVDVVALEHAGAAVIPLSSEEFWAAREPAYHLVVVGGLPVDRMVAFLRELRANPSTRLVPRLAIVHDPKSVDRLVRTGAVTIVYANDRASDLVVAAEELAARRPDVSGARGELDDELLDRTRELERQRQYTAALVHDTRVLLAVAMGFACNLRDGIQGELDEEKKATVERIVSAVQDASSLLERPAPTTRHKDDGTTASVRRVPRRTNVNLEALVRDVVTLFEESAREGGITLSASVVEPLRAWCDSVQIKQAVVNLVVNALKFTPAGGQVVISVERSVPLSSASLAGRTGATIVVADSGPGVPPEDRERIFERGYRLSRDASIAGHGIGLAVVKDIALAHQGAAFVEEASLGGAAFSMRIPIDLRKRDPGGLLVLEDGDGARELLTLLTDGHSLDVIAAKDPKFVGSALSAEAVVVLPRATPSALRDVLTQLRGRS